MSTDTRSHRDREASSKRKTRDGSEDVPPARKKVHRKADKADEGQFVDFGSKGDASKPKVTRKYKDKFAPKPEKEYPSINDLKKRIRDVKRLLNKMDLSADARILQERALAGYEQDLADETLRRERSSLIKKYHFVRFLDRKTATKELNRLTRREKEEDLDSKQKTRLAAKIHTCQVNLNYAIYYPLTEKYISIYPSGKPDATDPKSELQTDETKSNDSKPPLWPVVEKCMEEKTLDLLRNGKLHINANGEKIQTLSSGTTTSTDIQKEKSKKKETKAATQKDKHVSKDDKNSSKKEKPARSERASKKDEASKQANADDQDDSDGGFFE
ncbi:rRNA-processing protein EFG1 [Penicillium concentricum]|uniref:rRNA-processing protein EFG1 n=1 Tax=Penicillium concentricum TaxID=293559 RepID=A0A9W9VLQ2_9EURO|nr:rRNA-processing protein EFG1 [Penicillium concentricum]KAJ5385106.1 rRNA-processing protein EFG1 [Penicillium concentricum]